MRGAAHPQPADAPAHPDFAGVVLITVAILATIFNDLKPLLPIGELSNDGFIYVMPLLLLYLLRAPGKIGFRFCRSCSLSPCWPSSSSGSRQTMTRSPAPISRAAAA